MLTHMPAYHVEQAWRAKRLKKAVSHDLHWKIPINLPKTNLPKVAARATQS